MTRQIFMRFIIPCGILSSIFVGAVFNFLSFMNPGIVDNVGSWFITTLNFSDLLAITFILFTFILLITIKFIDKIARNSTLIASVTLTGFSLIYTSFSWNWQIYFINFLITGVGIGFIFPILIRLTIRAIPSDRSKRLYLIFFLTITVVWAISFGFLFMLLGVGYWRLLFIIVGIINIFSSILIINLEKVK